MTSSVNAIYENETAANENKSDSLDDCSTKCLDTVNGISNCNASKAIENEINKELIENKKDNR